MSSVTGTSTFTGAITTNGGIQPAAPVVQAEGSLTLTKASNAGRTTILPDISEKLIQKARKSGEKAGLGQNLYSYGVALIDSDDVDGASAAFAEAKEMGPDVLGAELFRAVVDALK